MPIYYVDGRFVPSEQAMIPVDDLALLRGIGVFDLIRTYKGKPLFLQEHLERLFQSAQHINLSLPWTVQDINRVVLDTLAQNRLAEANIRIIITGGSSSDFLTPSGNPRLLVMVTPLPQLPQWWFEKGIKVVTIRGERRIPGAKSIDYLAATMAMEKAKAHGAVEAVYVDRNQLALEGTTSNLFVFLKDELVTPGEGVLSGITRQVVLDLAAPQFKVQTRDLYYDELIGASEVFITGTNKGIVPVIQVDDVLIGNGQPGEHTRMLMGLLVAHMAVNA